MSCPSVSENSWLSSDKEGQESPNCGFVTSKERSFTWSLYSSLLSTIPPTLLRPCPLSSVLRNKSFMNMNYFIFFKKERNLSGIMMGGQLTWKRGEIITMVLEGFLLNSFYSICLFLSAFFIYTCAEFLLKYSWCISATVGIFFQTSVLTSLDFGYPVILFQFMVAFHIFYSLINYLSPLLGSQNSFT